MADSYRPRFHTHKIGLPSSDEIDRIAHVATAGFYHSPANAFERPKRDDFPRDTFASYRQTMLTYHWGPECILIVARDKYEKSEDEELYPGLKREFGGREWPTKDGMLIVGFACLTLKKGSSRKGQFQPEGDPPHLPDDDEIPKRDQSQEGLDKLAGAIEPSITTFFGGEFSVDMIAVHPKYWRRGHGTSLLLWAARLADTDQVPIGVASVQMGIRILQYVGFQKKAIVEVQGYSEHPDRFPVWIGVREAGSLPSVPKSEPQVSWIGWVIKRVGFVFTRHERQLL